MAMGITGTPIVYHLKNAKAHGVTKKEFRRNRHARRLLCGLTEGLGRVQRGEGKSYLGRLNEKNSGRIFFVLERKLGISA